MEAEKTWWHFGPHSPLHVLTVEDFNYPECVSHRKFFNDLVTRLSCAYHAILQGQTSDLMSDSLHCPSRTPTSFPLYISSAHPHNAKSSCKRRMSVPLCLLLILRAQSLLNLSIPAMPRRDK